MPITPAAPKVALAHFKTLTGSPTVEFDVHFNPESLEYSVANTLKEEGQGSSKKQYIDKTTAKLTMQLVFDTTDTGEDVRTHTDKVAALLKPTGSGSKQVPPNVEFSWGLYRFTGMVEQHKETIDFFAASGVPLRAAIDLTLASQDVQFESAKNPKAAVDQNLTPEPAVVPSGGGPGSGPSGVANALGDPRAARAIGAANASASLRFGAEGGLAIGASVSLQAEAAFSVGASAGIGGGIGIGGGAGIGIGGGAGIGIGGGAGIGIGGGAGIGIGGAAGIGIGGGAGIGIGGAAGIGTAAGGAFAGLRSVTRTSVSLPSGQALFGSAGASVGAVGGGASFGFGGRAQTQTGASLGAKVGADADLSARIRFG